MQPLTLAVSQVGKVDPVPNSTLNIEWLSTLLTESTQKLKN
jgi:hypothetical protein